MLFLTLNYSFLKWREILKAELGRESPGGPGVFPKARVYTERATETVLRIEKN